MWSCVCVSHVLPGCWLSWPSSQSGVSAVTSPHAKLLISWATALSPLLHLHLELPHTWPACSPVVCPALLYGMCSHLTNLALSVLLLINIILNLGAPSQKLDSWRCSRLACVCMIKVLPHPPHFEPGKTLCTHTQRETSSMVTKILSSTSTDRYHLSSSFF